MAILSQEILLIIINNFFLLIFQMLLIFIKLLSITKVKVLNLLFKIINFIINNYLYLILQV